MEKTMRTNNYLIHHGVKGMKWGVRHDKPSLGTRYRNWGVNKANKSYDKKISKVNSRREKARKENWLIGTKYGNAVNRENDKRYDKKISKIEQRRARKIEEFKISQKEDNKQIKKSGLTDKQKQTLKKVALGAAIVAGVGLATYGGVKIGQNIKLNKKAMSLIDDTIRKNARETISDYIHTSNKSVNRAMNSADIAKLAGDKMTMNNYVKSAKSIERDVANIKKNANRIIEDRVKSVPMKEKKAEARKLVKELKSMNKRNEAMRKAFNKGKVSKYLPQEPEYVTPTKWITRRYPDWDKYRK